MKAKSVIRIKLLDQYLRGGNRYIYTASWAFLIFLLSFIIQVTFVYFSGPFQLTVVYVTNSDTIICIENKQSPSPFTKIISWKFISHIPSSLVYTTLILCIRMYSVCNSERTGESIPLFIFFSNVHLIWMTYIHHSFCC